MAKSARATSRKNNNTALRTKVFGPVEDARAARLSEKLMRLAAAPKPASAEMEVEKGDVASSKEVNATDKNMEVDEVAGKPVQPLKSSSKKTPSRVQKKRRGKPHAQMVFKNKGKNSKLGKKK